METSEDQEPREATSRRRSQRGASLVEYALLLALIAIACLGALYYFGNSSANSVGSSCHKLLIAENGAPGGC